MNMTGRLLLPVITLLAVGAIYLAVNARLANTGRQVLVMQDKLDELKRQYAELEATYASLTTPDQLWERALEMGFRPATNEEVEYVIVDGYRPPEPFVAPLPPSSLMPHEPGLSPAYTETLGDWLSRWVGKGADR
jgi:hypothetical protein